MNKGIPGTAGDQLTKRFYHGTRAVLKPGELIEPGNPTGVVESNRMTTYVYLTPNLDAAIWEAEIAAGEGPGRVYIVDPIGKIEDTSDQTGQNVPHHLSMSCRSREPLRVTGKVTEWLLYHGTRADLKRNSSPGLVGIVQWRSAVDKGVRYHSSAFRHCVYLDRAKEHVS